MFNIRFNTSFTWSSYVAYGRVDQSTWMLTWDVDISFHRWCDQGSVISPCLMLICGIYKIDRCSLFLLFHIFSSIIFKYTHCIYSRGLKHWVILWLFCSWLLLKFVLCYSVFIIDCFLLLSRCGTHSPFKKNGYENWRDATSGQCSATHRIDGLQFLILSDKGFHKLWYFYWCSLLLYSANCVIIITI